MTDVLVVLTRSEWEELSFRAQRWFETPDEHARRLRADAVSHAVLSRRRNARVMPAWMALSSKDRKAA